MKEDRSVQILIQMLEEAHDNLAELGAKYFRLQTVFRYFAFLSLLTIGLLILWKI